MSELIRPTPIRLPHEDIERHTTWLEIFFDLIFAVIVVQLSDRLSNNLTIIGILQCCALFLPAMWTWANHTVFAARFDNNDAIHWVMTFVIMFAGAIMAIQIPTALEDGAMGYSVGFLIAQVSILLLYFRTLFDNTRLKKITYFYLYGFGSGGVCWAMSLFFDPPLKFIFWILGTCIYLAIPWIGRRRTLSKAPLHTVFIPERFGSFTVIVLGQIIASVVFGLESASWYPSAVITSMMAFVLAILVWGKYYRFTQIADYKCTLGSGQPYIFCHIPLIFSLMMIGVCTQGLIVDQLVHDRVKITFFFSIMCFLVSFYLLQYIAICDFKFQGTCYAAAMVAVLALFLYPLSSVFIMTGITMVFLALFTLQYKFERKHKHKV